MFNRKPAASTPIASPNIGKQPNLPAKIPALAAQEPPLEAVKDDGVVLIGSGTRMHGEISDCSVLEILGVFEGTAVAHSVVVREGGGFSGSLQTDKAEVHGVVEGTIVVGGLLDIRSTGRVTAETTYGQLSVATGGHLAGNIQTVDALSIDAVDQPAASRAEILSLDGNGLHA